MWKSSIAVLVVFAGCGHHEPVRAPVRHERVASFMDPVTTPRQTLTACIGDSISAIVPAQPGTDWHVTRAPRSLSGPGLEMVDRWLGPGTPGLRLTWATVGAQPGNAAEIAIEDASVHQVVTLAVHLEQCHGGSPAAAPAPAPIDACKAVGGTCVPQADGAACRTTSADECGESQVCCTR